MARTAVSVLDGGEDAAGAGERRRQRRRWSRSANATHFSAALTSSLATILSATTPSARPMPYRRRKEAAGGGELDGNSVGICTLVLDLDHVQKRTPVCMGER